MIKIRAAKGDNEMGNKACKEKKKVENRSHIDH